MTETKRTSLHLNRDQLDGLASLTLEAPMASAVLYFLMKSMEEDNTVVAPSQLLEEKFQRSRTTITKATKKLIDDGWVTTTQTALGRTFVVNENLARKQ